MVLKRQQSILIKSNVLFYKGCATFATAKAFSDKKCSSVLDPFRQRLSRAVTET